MIRVGSFRQRASLYATLNPFDSVFLILGRVVSAPGCSHPPSRAPPEGRTLATYLASALHDVCGKPIPAPLKCHSAGRGTSVSTENTDACG
jgi:hypothetical protein